MKIHESFSCDNNKLTNLKGGPQYVGKDYSAVRNYLSSFECSPKSVSYPLWDTAEPFKKTANWPE